MKKLGLTLLLFGASLHADVLQVPGDYSTIQLAIDAAVAGDQVHISSGTYYEKIDLLGKAIQVVGIDGPQKTTIDATDLGGSVVVCMNNEGPKTVVSGFTLTGGTGTLHPIWKKLQGGGIFAYFTSPTVSNCIITGNQAEYAGGMWAQGFSSSISNISFVNNQATDPIHSGGGGIYLWDSSALVTDCTFENNSCAGSGGALKCKTSPSGSGNSIIRNCTFTLNQAPASGGAVAVHKASPTFEFCDFNNNSAAVSGGAASIFQTQVLFNACSFSNNASDSYAGAIRILESSVILEKCSLVSNTTVLYGGGIAVTGGDATSACSLSGCHIQDNNSGLGGAIAHVDIATTDIDTTVICGNGPDPITGAWVDLGGNTLSASCTTFCAGDIDASGNVNVTDILDLIADFGPCNGIDSCFSDLNYDGQVNVNDILILIGNWGDCQ